MWQKIKDALSSTWETLKDFFNRSTVILYARLQTLSGILLAAAGNIDWSAIAHLNWKELSTTTWVAVAMIANGLITELLRRRTLNVAA